MRRQGSQVCMRVVRGSAEGQILWFHSPGKSQAARLTEQEVEWGLLGLEEGRGFWSVGTRWWLSSGALCAPSSLENPRDRGALWAAVYRVALSQTRLKRPQKQQNESPVREEQGKGPGSLTVVCAGGGLQATDRLVFSGPNFV